MRNQTEGSNVRALLLSAPLVRLDLLTHSARLVDARKAKGLSQPELAKLVGCCSITISHLESLRVRLPRRPWQRQRRNDLMDRIANILEKPVDYLFPEVLLEAVEVGVFDHKQVELTETQVISLTEAERLRILPPPATFAEVEAEAEVALDKEFLIRQFQAILDILDPRSKRVIELRFGLEDGRARTLEEVSKEFGVSRERIRQIETKALRWLRHPRRSSLLKAFR